MTNHQIKRLFSSFRIKPKFNFAFVWENIQNIENNCKKRDRPFDREKFQSLFTQLNRTGCEIERIKNSKLQLSREHKEEHQLLRKELRLTQSKFESIQDELTKIVMALPNDTSGQSPPGSQVRVISTFGKQQFSDRMECFEEEKIQNPSLVHDKILTARIDNEMTPTVGIVNEEVQNFNAGVSKESTLEKKILFQSKEYLNCSHLNHVDVGKKLGLFDFEQASKLIGSKWVYLLHNGAILENALVQYALNKLLPKGFRLVYPPDVADTELVSSCGYYPKESGTDLVLYRLEKCSLALAATSEILLAGLHAQSVIPQQSLPIRYLAVSHCFRPEVGHYGKNSRGLYRLHQFTKVEMFSFTLPADSDAMLEQFVEIQREIIEELGLRGRKVEMGAYELGNSAYRKIDIEVEMPMRGEWGEVTSASNCTDYQTSRLCIFGKDENNQRILLHTVNGTAIAVPRIIQALIESNYSVESGKMRIPSVLWPFTFGMTEI